MGAEIQCTAHVGGKSVQGKALLETEELLFRGGEVRLKLKLEGFSRRELWATTLLESVLLVGVGCLSGAAFGLYGQQLLDRALASVINYPVVSSLALAPALASFAIVLGAALAIIALPGYLASGVPAAVALQD